MSSAVVSTSAALGRPFLFEDESEPEVFCHPERSGKCVKRISRGVEGSLPYRETSLDPRLESITTASRLEIRQAPEMAPSGIPALDALIGGLPRGCLTEIYGPASSGRTSVMLAALAAATRRGEYCALIDASDALDPHSLAAANVDLDRLLWVRCNENSPQRHRNTEKTNREKEFIANKSSAQHTAGADKIGKGTALAVPSGNSSNAALAAEGHRLYDSQNRKQSERRLEQVLRTTDLLLESGGFGLILLDLADIPYQSARRIPLATWFRFRRAVEHKPTILLAIEQQPIAGSCSSLQLRLGSLAARPENFMKFNPYDVSAAKRRQNAAHGASRGEMTVIEYEAPKGRKKNCLPVKTASLSFPSHAYLLTKLEILVELIRSRLDRKPARSVAFETKTAWAG